MTENMKKLLKLRKGEIALMLISFAGFGIMGTLLHDLIVRMDTDEMTVFPLGTLLVLVGIFFINVMLAAIYDRDFYQRTISYGGTRREFLIGIYGQRFAVNIMSIPIAFAFNLFENWKFRRFFPDYEVDIKLSAEQVIAFAMIAVIAGMILNLTMLAISIRFQLKAQFNILIFYLVAMLFMVAANFADDFDISAASPVLIGCIALTGPALVVWSLKVIKTRGI